VQTQHFTARLKPRPALHNKPSLHKSHEAVQKLMLYVLCDAAAPFQNNDFSSLKRSCDTKSSVSQLAEPHRPLQ